MTLVRMAMVLLLPVCLAGCLVPDESGADAVWRPKGINAANLAAMVVDPADLTRGHGDPGPDRKQSAGAVLRLWANPTAPLAHAAGAATPSAMQSGEADSAGSGGGAPGGTAPASPAAGN